MIGSTFPAAPRQGVFSAGSRAVGRNPAICRRTARLGALLTLLAVAYGCGSTLPTSPEDGSEYAAGGPETARKAGNGSIPRQTASSIDILPDSIELYPAKSSTFSAKVRNFKGELLSETVTWSATGGSITAGGVYTAGSTLGTFRVIGKTSNGVADTARVVISPKPMTIDVQPESVSLAAGAAHTFSAEVRDADGNPLSTEIRWEATGGAIDAAGRYVAGTTTGSYRVIGSTSNGRADTASVSIGTTPAPTPEPASIAVSPEAVDLAPGAAQTFAAQVRDAGGNVLSAEVTWQATGGAIDAAGRYVAGTTTGSYRVIGSTSNGRADTSAVRIVRVPASIVVQPGSAQLLTGASQSFSAEVRDAGGALMQDAVTWSATGGTIDAAGKYTAGSVAGSYQVVGRTSNGKADTASVTIEAPVISSGPVYAGADRTIALSEAVTLNATVSDGALVHRFWEKMSGPGSVTFGHEEFYSGFENPDFSEWRRHEARGDGLATSPHRSGRSSWAAQADPTLPDPDNHAAKVLHWGTTDYPELYISAWFYFPSDYVMQQKVGNFLNLLQFKERVPTPDLHDPTWIVGARKATTVSGDAELVVMDWQKVTGKAFYYSNLPLPKDRWVQVAVYIKMHHTSGALIVWVDGEKEWEFRNVNTLGGAANTSYLMWGVGNYGKDVAENEAVYWDDVRAWRADQNDALSTTARFSEPGTYVLRLMASDGSRTERDEVTVTVR